MEEKKFVVFKKEELGVKEYVKRSLGKGKISTVSIEYTPIGEKIVVSTSKPGLVIGRKGEKIEELTKFIKKRFKFDNPHIEIREIMEPLFDSQLVADDIAVALEREGSLKFKVIAYKMLQEIMRHGALGAEIVLSGKLPSERARSWRFAQGYLKKTGNPAKVVDRAMSQAQTLPGIIGIKVSILPPNAVIHDRISLSDDLKRKIQMGLNVAPEVAPVEKVAIVEKKARKAKSKKSEESDGTA